MKTHGLFAALLILFCSSLTLAQHEHHAPPKLDTIKTDKSKKQNKAHQTDRSRMTDHYDSSLMHMTHAYSLSLPMNRNSSGTAWQPDATPMYGYMKMTDTWNFMFHGSLFLRYNYQDISGKGIRSDELTDRVDAPNWFMMMAQRKVWSNGLLAFSVMLSADAFVMGMNGYPLLFQTGETANGEPLIDRQHPHDLFSGLTAAYTHRINQNTDVTLYIGYPGEPALGPPAFMHRISTFNNPDAPLGHHWQDATHITFGVATIGFRYRKLKLEFSSFTGREPDENRYDFDKPGFDSYSYRLSLNPDENFSFQVSQGFLKGPEAHEPEEDITRTTASVMHAIILGEKVHLTSSLIWGLNQKTGGKQEQSTLLESNLQVNKTAIYGRYEATQKSAHELELDQFEDRTFWINAITLGSNYNLSSICNTNFKIGAQGTLYMAPNDLEPFYGKTPAAIQVYLRLTPVNMNIYESRNLTRRH